MNKTGYVKLNTDDWEDAGKIYKVLNYNRRDNSTAVDLRLQLEGGQIMQRTIAYHMVEWIGDSNW